MINLNYFNILIIILLPIFISENKNIENNNSDFIFTISTDKQEYIEGENVFATFTIKNTGDKIDSVANFISDLLFDFTELINEKDTIKMSRGMDGMHNIYYSKLKPGESYSTEQAMNYNGANAGYGFFPHYKVGKYYMQSKFKDLKGKPIISNIVSFNVFEPSGEEKQAFEEFKPFGKYYSTHINSNEDELKDLIDKAEIYIDKYPISVYTPRVIFHFDFTRQIFHYKYDEKYLNQIETFIMNNPSYKWNITFLYALTGLSMKLNGKSDTINYLIKLKEIFNNDTLSGYINEVLEKDELLK